MQTKRPITTSFGTVTLTRECQTVWTLTLRGIAFRFVRIDDVAEWMGETIRQVGWNLEIDGECNDRYQTLARAVEDAQGWALENGEGL